MSSTHDITNDLKVMELQVDLYTALNKCKETFDQYVDTFPILEISPQNSDSVSHYIQGLQSLIEGMILIKQTLKAICMINNITLKS